MPDRRPSPARKNVTTGSSKPAGQLDVRRRTRRHAGSGGSWHELTTNGNSGSGHRSLALRGTKARHGRTDSGSSCTMPAAAERLATARAGGKGKAARPYHQRCAVRVTYLKNKIRGQWKAHGRYLARESATFENDAKAGGIQSGEQRDRHRRAARKLAGARAMNGSGN